MIKKTLYFGNPAYLSTRKQQLVVRLVADKNVGADADNAERTFPIEDIGVVVLDHAQITLTQPLLSLLLQNNCALINCNDKHMPFGLLLPLDSNTVQQERFEAQLNASLPLKKQLWTQTVQAKIRNQAFVLERKINEVCANMYAWADDVKSGDSTNKEAQAAAFYWKHVWPEYPDFFRDQYGPYPNCLLNYGYAILRAVVARALVSTGLLPTMGIHHHNRYNAYCLADDVMEPYRPYVDQVVLDIAGLNNEGFEMTKEQKIELLKIPTLDVSINGRTRPLEIAVSYTTASLYKCFSGELRKISYPEMC